MANPTWRDRLSHGGQRRSGQFLRERRNSYLPAKKNVPQIREYSRDGKLLLSTVNVPEAYQNHRNNLGLESLTISADGNVMWTANEEALTVDGLDADFNRSTTVRLQKFVRSGDTWDAKGSLPMRRGRDWRQASCRTGMRVVCRTSACCPTANCWCSSDDWEVAAFQHSITRSFLIDTALATDVSGLDGLDGATYSPVTKASLWSQNFSVWDNFEGLCLGQQLSADTWSLLMVSDGDDPQLKSLYSLRLQGEAVPEPSSLVLMALGCGGMGFWALRRTKRRVAL